MSEENIVKLIIMPDGTRLSLQGSGGGASGDFVTRSEFDSTVGDIQEALDQIINGVIE